MGVDRELAPDANTGVSALTANANVVIIGNLDFEGDEGPCDPLSYYEY
jgi:hypothetical protein